MFMSQISRVLNEPDYTSKLNNLIVKVARFQFGLHGLIITGFALLGRDFVLLWLDETYIDVYYGILLVTVPTLLYYSLQIANTALMIKNHVKLQAFTNVLVGVVNVCLAFVLSKHYGVLGACSAIFIAYSIRNIGYFIVYRQKLDLDARKLCTECYIPLGMCMLITWILGTVANYIIDGRNWMTFLLRVMIVTVVYMIAILIIGLKSNERKQVYAMISRKIRRA